MFEYLSDFGRVRSPREALGFYLAYLALGFLLLVSLGFAAGIVVGLGHAVDLDRGTLRVLGEHIGVLGVMVYALVLCAAIVARKNLGFGAYVVTLLTIPLGSLGGAALGLLPAAWLATRASRRVPTAP